MPKKRKNEKFYKIKYIIKLIIEIFNIINKTYLLKKANNKN